MLNKITVRTCIRASKSLYAGVNIIVPFKTHKTLSFSFTYHLKHCKQLNTHCNGTGQHHCSRGQDLPFPFSFPSPPFPVPSLPLDVRPLKSGGQKFSYFPENQLTELVSFKRKILRKMVPKSTNYNAIWPVIYVDISDQLSKLYILFWRWSSLHRPNMCIYTSHPGSTTGSNKWICPGVHT